MSKQRDWPTSFNSVSRRTLLWQGVVLAAELAAPAIVSPGALASSGEVNFMGWAGYDYSALFMAFNAETGVKVNLVEQPDNESMLAQSKLALQSGGIDFCEPVVQLLQSYIENGLVQPWDERHIDLGGYEPSLVNGATGSLAVVGGRRYFLPSVWGTEALVYHTELAPLVYGTASLGDLFDPKYAGVVTVRPHSALAAMGRYLESIGKLPQPFRDGYTDMEVMRQDWDVILAEAIRAKANIAQFWKSENEAQAAFRSNGCVLGECWDSTGFNLQNDGLPFAYVSPKEGAFAWLQGYLLLKNAVNVEQAQAFAGFVATPKGSALLASAVRANPAAKGAVDLLDPKVASFYRAAFPGDALSRLWWWPSVGSEFLARRNEYADRYQAA